MANIDALWGYNDSGLSTNKLFAAYGNDIVDVDSGTGYSQNLTPGTKGSGATYINYSFFANGTDATRSFDGSSWSKLGVVNRCPIAKYLKVYGTRLFMGFVTINSQSYPSRVWYSDLPYNNKPRWGAEWGSALGQTASSATITDPAANFETYGIKAGDTVTILTGNNTGEYTVGSVDSEIQITLTETLDNTVASSTYWIGSNWFDAGTDSNDYIRGLGENSDRLLVFKLNSLYRYDGGSLYQVKGSPGTNSNESVRNVRDVTLYFHGSSLEKTGIYLYDGRSSINVSGAIQPYIDGISADDFGNVVAWVEGDCYRCFVGDITNSQRNISVTKAVLSYNVTQNKWSVDPINKTPTCSATFTEDGTEKIFFGDDSAEVFETPSGYDFDGDPIPWAMETGIKYPVGSEVINRLTRMQVVARDARGVRVRYKLIDRPEDSDTQWQPLDDLEHDKTEIRIPTNHNSSSGINIRLEETGTGENTQQIEKISIFYVPEGTKMV